MVDNLSKQDKLCKNSVFGSYSFKPYTDKIKLPFPKIPHSFNSSNEFISAFFLHASFTYDVITKIVISNVVRFYSTSLYLQLLCCFSKKINSHAQLCGLL